MRRHQMPGDQRIFRKVQRNSKGFESAQDLLQLLRTHVSLVLMRLQADRSDRNSRVQAGGYQLRIFFA